MKLCEIAVYIHRGLVKDALIIMEI